ncbi:MAG: histidinol-phosphatase [Gemmatimonadales bacterium]
MSTMQELLQAVTEVARRAGSVAQSYFGTGVAVEWKADGSPVTVADRTAEEAARAWILERFPNDAVLGEEFGLTGNATGRRWILDPIDGTKSFVSGVPLWGTLVAVVEGDEILAGAINCAAAGELLSAARGEGAWLNGSRCRVSDRAALDQAVVLTTDERYPESDIRRDAWRKVAAQARVVRTWGDCFGYLLVATGRADVMVDDKMNPWDSACLLPIIEEAGGVFTDWRGRRTGFGGDSIATNAALDRTVRDLLCETPS